MLTLSVIVRTHHRASLLKRALASIADQSYPVDEIVVVHDGPASDNTERIVGEFKGNVLFVESGAPLGRAGALNLGIERATSEWLGFLDDDDTFEPRFVELMLQKAQCIAGIGGVVCRTIEVSEEEMGGEWREISRRKFGSDLKCVRMQDLVLANRFTNNAFIFPKSALASVGRYRNDLAVLEDWEFNVRFAKAFPIHVLPIPLAHYRRRPEGNGNLSNSRLEMHREVQIALREEWMRDDLRTGRFGIGVLAMLAEIESNRGLRLANKISDWMAR